MDITQLAGTAGATNLVLKVTVLLVVGWSAARVLRRAPSGVRHLVWLSVIVGSLLIPALARVASVRLAMLPGTEAASLGPTTGAGAGTPIDFASTAVAGPVAPAGRSADSATTWLSRPGYGVLAISAWLGGMAAFVAWLIAGLVSIRRVLRGARNVDSADWTDALRDAARRLGMDATPRLLISDQVETAFACRALAPTIVLPRSADAWSREQRRTVLLHELAHVRRLDLVGHAVASIACAVYWFHPLVWVAARRVRAESERACDEMVINSGVRASDYAQHLLDMVTTIGHRHGAPTLALPIVRSREFEGRLVAILERACPRPPVGRGKVVALIGLLGLLTTSIAAVVPVPRTPAPSATRPVVGRANTAPVSAPVVRPSAPAPIPSASITPRRRVAREAIILAPPRLEISLAPCERVTGGQPVPVLVDTAFHRLFNGITLAPAQEAKACQMLIQLHHEQMAEDSIAGVVFQADRERSRAVETQRNAALRALLTNDADRATFDAHVAQGSAGGGLRGRSGGPPVDWTGGGRGGGAGGVRGGGGGGGGGARGRQGVGGDSSVILGGGRGGRGLATDSAAKDLRLALVSVVSAFTFKQLFEGITLSPEQEASARGIITVAQQSMPAPVPSANRLRLRIAPVPGVVTMQATSAAELLALITNDADRATVQSRIVSLRITSIR